MDRKIELAKIAFVVLLIQLAISTGVAFVSLVGVTLLLIPSLIFSDLLCLAVIPGVVVFAIGQGFLYKKLSKEVSKDLKEFAFAIQAISILLIAPVFIVLL